MSMSMSVSMREGFFCRVESLASTLCEIVCWAAMFPSPMHNPFPFPTHQGLKALTASSDQKEVHRELIAGSGFVVHSYNISSAPTSAPLSKSSSCDSLSGFLSYPSPVMAMGDLIGTESGVYMSSDQELVAAAAAALEKGKPDGIGVRLKKGSQEPATETKYPPPIPLLAGTGNLAAHMPWVLTRRCTNDGKLILTEERGGKYQEYLEAKREDGRLLLSLVSLGGDDDDVVDEMEQEEEEEVLYFMDGIHGGSDKDTEAEPVDLDIYDDDDSCDEEKGKELTGKNVEGMAMQKRGSVGAAAAATLMLASSMPEIPPANLIHEKSIFGRRCLTPMDRGSSESSNIFRPMVGNIIYT